MNDGDDVEPQRLNGQNGGYYDDDDGDDGIDMAMAMMMMPIPTMMMLNLTEHKARLNR